MYLKKHMYGNTCTEDLWDAFEEASGLRVGEVMNNWVTMKGYPLLTVSEYQRNATVATLRISQKRFTAHGAIEITNTKDLWKLPIQYITNDESKKTLFYMLLDKKSEITVQTNSVAEWIELNPKWIGFYRVKYTEPLNYKLMAPIMDKSISNRDRMSLISDAFQLASAGEKPTVEYLNFVKAYIEEDDLAVWQVLEGHFSLLNTILSNTEFQAKLRPFIYHTCSRLYEKAQPWAQLTGEESDNLLGLKVIAIRRLGLMAFQPVVDEAKRLFQDHRSGKKELDVKIRAIIYQIVAKDSYDDETYKYFIDRYIKTNAEEEKARCAGALMTASKESRVRAVMRFAVSVSFGHLDISIVRHSSMLYS